MIKLNNISRSFNKVPALHPFSYEAKEGEVSVFIGPSGCGKSTLLRLINGLIEPDSGEIIIDGQGLDQQSVFQLRQQMGYVIQEGGLFPHLRARANVSIMAEYLQWSSDKINSRIDELSALVQLSPSLLSRYPLELSGGQRQRISLMRALMLDPKVLLMDEPLGALDPMIRFDLQQELLAIFQQLNKTVILVTHDIAEAAHFSDVVLLFREGRMLQQGSFSELMNNPANEFVQKFIHAQIQTLDSPSKGDEV